MVLHHDAGLVWKLIHQPHSLPPSLPSLAHSLPSPVPPLFHRTVQPGVGLSLARLCSLLRQTCSFPEARVHLQAAPDDVSVTGVVD